MRCDLKGRAFPPFLVLALSLAVLLAAPLGALGQSARAPVEQCEDTLARIVEFASHRTTLDKAARALVARQAKCLAEIAAKKVSVEGYWDDSGTQAKSGELSLRLATRVRDELVKAGVDESRIVIVGHGREGALDPDRPHERRRAVRVLVNE